MNRAKFKQALYEALAQNEDVSIKELFDDLDEDAVVELIERLQKKDFIQDFFFKNDEDGWNKLRGVDKYFKTPYEFVDFIQKYSLEDDDKYFMFSLKEHRVFEDVEELKEYLIGIISKNKKMLSFVKNEIME